MTKTENFMLLYLLSQNDLYLEELHLSKRSLEFMSGAMHHYHNIVHIVKNITEILEKTHEPEDFEKLYQKEFIKKLYYENTESEGAAQFLVEKYRELGGDPDEL